MWLIFDPFADFSSPASLEFVSVSATSSTRPASDYCILSFLPCVHTCIFGGRYWLASPRRSKKEERHEGDEESGIDLQLCSPGEHSNHLQEADAFEWIPRDQCTSPDLHHSLPHFDENFSTWRRRIILGEAQPTGMLCFSVGKSSL
jgi:hypothetical protein